MTVSGRFNSSISRTQAKRRHVPYDIVAKKCLNMSHIRSSNSRSNITTHDRTFSTVSRIETLLPKEGISISSKFRKASTIIENTSLITLSSLVASGAVILVISDIQDAMASHICSRVSQQLSPSQGSHRWADGNKCALWR